MKYQVHPRLGSFFAIAMALFREMADAGPSFGESMLKDGRQSQVTEVADLFGKLALLDAANAEEFRQMNEALTAAARDADLRRNRTDSFYRDDTRTFADGYPGFDGVSSLDEQPDLFDPQPDPVHTSLKGEYEAKYLKMVGAAYSIMPDRDSEDWGRFVLGLCLLVAATVIRAREWSLPDVIPYPELRQDVVLPHRAFRVGAGSLMGAQELQFRVHSMARAVIARVPFQQ